MIAGVGDQRWAVILTDLKNLLFYFLHKKDFNTTV
jgi:hypothetical protein